jgi:hypothetical protein
MWIALFSSAIAVAICFIVAAVLMRDRDRTAEFTRLSLEMASIKTQPTGSRQKNAPPIGQAAIYADDVDQHSLRAANVMPCLQTNASSTRTFGKASHTFRNVSGMMNRLRFNLEMLPTADLNNEFALGTCHICPADDLCNNWLVRTPRSFKRAPAFCPDAERFDCGIGKAA